VETFEDMLPNIRAVGARVRWWELWW